LESLSPTTVPVRIAFSVADVSQGHALLKHLIEERLIAGGTVVHAESLNWVGGNVTEKERRELTAYTTYDKIALITERLEVLCPDHPTISRFVMDGEKEEVTGWITRNVR